MNGVLVGVSLGKRHDVRIHPTLLGGQPKKYMSEIRAQVVVKNQDS